MNGPANVQEELDIGKRVVDLSNVTVRTRVVEQPVSEDVSLQRERVDIQRRQADRALPPEEADNLLRDNSIEVTERGEEAVVGKSARVVEEVIVRKGTETYTQRVEANVRHTEVDVDRDGTPIGGDDRRR
ncbi:YsnF/AvaK domain-containing protein [Sandarakinorhabdus sp.]|uniref:YsnF/AvaK domain-containing protein n=1 Tax=Sandarakinorhabdus sp. TaxID=1916663 RepID=UPI003F72123D